MNDGLEKMRTGLDEVWKAIKALQDRQKTQQAQIDSINKGKGEWLSFNAKVHESAENLTDRLEEMVQAMAGTHNTDRRSDDNE